MADHEFIRGDHESLTITFDASIANHKLFFTAKRRPNLKDTDDLNAVFKKTSDAGTIVKLADNLSARVDFVPADTNDFTREERLHYDVKAVDGAGKVSTTEKGTLKVAFDVTREVS